MSKGMLRVYLYRRIGAERDKYPNPYISNLESSLSQNFRIVNQRDNTIGVIDPFTYLFKSDIFYFNWIENISKNKWGKFQCLVFVFFLFVARWAGKKVVWTLHNKYAHDAKKNYWTDLMYKNLLRYSNLVVTHSGAGVDFIKENYSHYNSKVVYIMHPATNIMNVVPTVPKKYDLLIWGNIQPYKGLIEFLRFVKGNQRMGKMQILIAGTCYDSGYKDRIKAYLSENIVYRDEFYSLEQIASFASQTKFILFTYHTASILSSGSLMDSIAMQTPVIGPNDGAFKDLATSGFVHTYASLEELPDICNDNKKSGNATAEMLADFYHNNTWGKFSERLLTELNNLF